MTIRTRSAELPSSLRMIRRSSRRDGGAPAAPWVPWRHGVRTLLPCVRVRARAPARSTASSPPWSARHADRGGACRRAVGQRARGARPGLAGGAPPSCPPPAPIAGCSRRGSPPPSRSTAQDRSSDQLQSEYIATLFVVYSMAGRLAGRPLAAGIAVALAGIVLISATHGDRSRAGGHRRDQRRLLPGGASVRRALLNSRLRLNEALTEKAALRARSRRAGRRGGRRRARADRLRAARPRRPRARRDDHPGVGGPPAGRQATPSARRPRSRRSRPPDRDALGELRTLLEVLRDEARPARRRRRSRRSTRCRRSPSAPARPGSRHPRRGGRTGRRSRPAWTSPPTASCRTRCARHRARRRGRRASSVRYPRRPRRDRGHRRRRPASPSAGCSGCASGCGCSAARSGHRRRARGRAPGARPAAARGGAGVSLLRRNGDLAVGALAAVARHRVVAVEQVTPRGRCGSTSLAMLALGGLLARAGARRATRATASPRC